MLLIAAVILQRYIDNYIVLRKYLTEFQRWSVLNPIVMLSTAFKFITVLALPVTVRFLNYANEMNRLQQLLQQQKLEAELSSLKNQIQPHFLFNTLNSLYSLILKKSDKAVQVVLRLSELLRYVLYESEQPKIALQKEIEFIKSYIELEQMRLGTSARIEFEVFGDANSQHIAPLIIMPFVENSVKHCAALPGRENVILIKLSVSDNFFQLHVKNPTMQEASLFTMKEGGIGIKNVSKRLEILYQGKHKLEMKNEADWFEVNLNIELT